VTLYDLGILASQFDASQFDGDHANAASAVPEPSSFVLAAVSIAMLLGMKQGPRNTPSRYSPVVRPSPVRKSEL
jgi:hypothetical protein